MMSIEEMKAHARKQARERAKWQLKQNCRSAWYRIDNPPNPTLDGDHDLIPDHIIDEQRRLQKSRDLPAWAFDYAKRIEGFTSAVVAAGLAHRIATFRQYVEGVELSDIDREAMLDSCGLLEFAMSASIARTAQKIIGLVRQASDRLRITNKFYRWEKLFQPDLADGFFRDKTPEEPIEESASTPSGIVGTSAVIPTGNVSPVIPAKTQQPASPTVVVPTGTGRKRIRVEAQACALVALEPSLTLAEIAKRIGCSEKYLSDKSMGKLREARQAAKAVTGAIPRGSKSKSGTVEAIGAIGIDDDEIDRRNGWVEK